MGTVLTRMVSIPLAWIKDWLTRPWHGSRRGITSTQSPVERGSPCCVHLHKMVKNKHTVVLKNSQHVDSVDVIGVLEETYTPGRYRLRSWQPVLRLNYTHLREIDIYFTDPSGAVIGAAVVGGGTSASDITGHASIFMFLDFEDEDKMTIISPSLLTEIIASNNSLLEFQPSSGSGIVWGPQKRSIMGA